MFRILCQYNILASLTDKYILQTFPTYRETCSHGKTLLRDGERRGFSLRARPSHASPSPLQPPPPLGRVLVSSVEIANDGVVLGGRRKKSSL